MSFHRADNLPSFSSNSSKFEIRIISPRWLIAAFKGGQPCLATLASLVAIGYFSLKEEKECICFRGDHYVKLF
jgi:hypothetical protein